MSWQAYVDSSLVGSGHVDKAAIVSVAGDSVWANSSGFTVQPAEMKTLISILNATGDAIDKAHADGVYVAGERYVVTRIEDRSIYGRQGRTGICAVKTKQAVIIAHYGETQVVGNATLTVEALADYLIKVGY
ncbi:profilin [Xylariaceae sp. FL0662B]|nr:profilin [Xylariaceae sp. FL0662B]